MDGGVVVDDEFPEAVERCLRDYLDGIRGEIPSRLALAPVDAAIEVAMVAGVASASPER